MIEKEELYKIAVETFDGYIYICSEDYTIQYMNQPFIERTGRDATGEKCYKALHELNEPCPFCVNDQVQKGETVRWETKSPKDNRWFYIVNRPLHRKDGSIWKYAFIIDITEKKKNEELILKKEIEYRELIENQDDYLVRVDENLFPKYCSNKFVELFPEYSDFENFIKGYFEKMKKNKLFNNKIIINQELNHRRKKLNINWKIIAIPASEDFLIVGRDITQIKNAERLKAEFLGNVSHEIRTPMTSIVGYSYLAEKTESKEKRNKYLTKISISSEHLLLLLNDIIDLSRIQSGDMEINYEKFSLNEVFSEVYSRFKKEAEYNDKINLIFDFLKEDVVIESDREKIIKLTSNLLSNAFKFTEDGFIRVSFRIEEKRLVLSVADSGIGIPDEKKEEIFEEFSQVDASTTRKYGGTGIGLTITERIVDMMGGEIDFSSFEGKGSTFEIRLPVSFEVLSKDRLSMETSEKENNILIIEDSKEIGIMLKEIFLKENLNVEIIFNGEKAIEYIREHKVPDLILLDIELPGMDGFDVINKIQSLNKTKNIPVIAMTAYANEVDRDECIANGFSDYIAKPFNLDHIISKVNEYL